MKPLRIRSWYLALFLGVTDNPKGEGDYMPVRLDAGGPTMFWRII